MHNQGEEKSVTERISRCHVNPTFLVLMIIFCELCSFHFHFQFWNINMTTTFLPVPSDYLDSVRCFCHIELGGRAWKCPLCNLGRTSRRTSQCLCDASRWDTLARRPSKSPRLPLDLQFRNEFYKVLKLVKVHLALFVVEWMRIKHCVLMSGKHN